jgi:broad specificity phosphatase PhoE
LLVRHGETVWNVEGRWQGQGDSPLTERGVAQARQLALALRDELIRAVYSSDLGRAMATAKEVAAQHALEVVPDPRLREINCGGMTGLTRVQIEEQFGDLLHRWAYHPATQRLPDGETLSEAHARALEFFAERMPAHANETVVVIAHGAIGQAILASGMGLGLDALWLKQRVDNCQISRLEWASADGLKLIELSDTRHLLEVGSLRGWRTTDPEAGTDAA